MQQGTMWMQLPQIPWVFTPKPQCHQDNNNQPVQPMIGTGVKMKIAQWQSCHNSNSGRLAEQSKGPTIANCLISWQTRQDDDGSISRLEAVLATAQ